MKPFTMIAVAVFSLVALLHLLRFLLQWHITVHNAIIPQWVSIFGFLIAGLLAFMIWREAKK